MTNQLELVNPCIAIVGLGYVGLPLAVEFGKLYKTLGYDLSESKIASYREYLDPTGEVSSKDLLASENLQFSTDPSIIRQADYIIVAVPTPVGNANVPDFGPLISATKTVAEFMRRGAVVVFESTVYPGATEEICVPSLEGCSGLVWKQDFFVGYSPERVNPGDKERTITKIVKVVAGDTKETLEKVTRLYSQIIHAGIHQAESIRVAEAAKVIENTQRDLNIALINELAIIFDRMEIKTADVLRAAGTKWNFLKFSPGLVGGHCIGVDPYYLTHKAEMLGYHPQVILAGRRINDSMAVFVAQKTVKLMIKSGIHVKGARVVVMGLTFKEDCPDLRNSKVIDVINELVEYGCNISVHDPIASPQEASEEYGIHLKLWEDLPREVDAIILAVPHRFYREKPSHELFSILHSKSVVLDLKGCISDSHSFTSWSL